MWLGRAAVAADMGAPAAALDDLEFALVQLRKNAKVGRRRIGGKRLPVENQIPWPLYLSSNVAV